jgi:hypothetical protein
MINRERNFIFCIFLIAKSTAKQEGCLVKFTTNKVQHIKKVVDQFEIYNDIFWTCPSCVRSGYPLQVLLRPGFSLLSLTQKRIATKTSFGKLMTGYGTKKTQ